MTLHVSGTLYNSGTPNSGTSTSLHVWVTYPLGLRAEGSEPAVG